MIPAGKDTGFFSNRINRNDRIWMFILQYEYRDLNMCGQVERKIFLFLFKAGKTGKLEIKSRSRLSGFLYNLIPINFGRMKIIK